MSVIIMTNDILLLFTSIFFPFFQFKQISHIHVRVNFYYSRFLEHNIKYTISRCKDMNMLC